LGARTFDVLDPMRTLHASGSHTRKRA